MLKDIYVLLDPVDMDTDDSQNHHIIRAKKDEKTGDLTFPSNRKVLCENWKKKSDATILPTQELPFDENDLRVRIAEEQNAGKELCANCVKHLYADNE